VSAPALAGDDGKPAEAAPAPADEAPSLLTSIPGAEPVADFKKQL
jgi:hypothetical protein